MNDRPQRRPVATTEQADAQATVSAQAKSDVALVLVYSPSAAQVGVVGLTERVVVVGRDVEGGGVTIDDSRLSRVHFRVAFDRRAQSHRIGDAQSRNGTFVEGVRVDSAVLRRGNVIRAGDSVFVYDDADPLKKVRDLVARIGPTDLSVLILGETGTGKERTARALHDASGRKGPFVAVNCAALPSALLGAELFGHTRGAFSGAFDARRGLFQSANGGTLFLDEIADAPLDLQATLLRALEERTVRPLGSDREVPIDTRVVAATHGDIQAAIGNGRFRADLHARLGHSLIRLPPVRERRADILRLVQEFASANGRKDLALGADAAEAIVRYAWPYNVREILSFVRGFVAMASGLVLDAAYLERHHSDLLTEFRGATAAESNSFQARTRDAPDRVRFESLLDKHRGNVSAIADEVHMTRTNVYRKLRTLGLDPNRYRS